MKPVIIHFNNEEALDAFLSRTNRVLHRISNTVLFCICSEKNIHIAKTYFNARVELVED